jgi:hypothetical protein
VNELIITIIVGILVGGALYRLRGGAFSNLSRRYGWEWGGKQRTQTMRLIWAIPTAAWIMFLWSQSWLVGLELIVTIFASMALLGHGAHMVYSIEDLRKGHWEGGGNDLEQLTFWLPWAFGGKPDATWDESRVLLFHMTGMSFIGLLRNTIAITPIFFVSPVIAGIYAVTGLLHGPLYFLGYKTPWKSEASEIIVGSVTWATIALIGSFV